MINVTREKKSKFIQPNGSIKQAVLQIFGRRIKARNVFISVNS